MRLGGDADRHRRQLHQRALGLLAAEHHDRGMAGRGELGEAGHRGPGGAEQPDDDEVQPLDHLGDRRGPVRGWATT